METEQATPKQRSSKKRLDWIIGCVIVVLAGGFFLQRVYTEHEQQAALQQQEATYRQQLYINPLEPKPASPFTLTDQHGKSISLASLQGKAVVLQFLDPKCADICPLISKEIIEANQHLGKKAQEVEFVAVNVNQYHASSKDLLDYSQEHNLDKLPNWHFLTGTTAELQAVWKAYGVDVIPSQDGDVQHSSLIYFINKNGQEEYLANPDSDTSKISEWGQGIAFFTDKML